MRLGVCERKNLTVLNINYFLLKKRQTEFFIFFLRKPIDHLSTMKNRAMF